MPDLRNLLDRIQRIDAELKQPVAHDQISFTERIEREDELAHLGMTKLPQLAKAVKSVLEFLEHRAHPSKSLDPTGEFGAILDAYDRTIRQAITDALGADDDRL